MTCRTPSRQLPGRHRLWIACGLMYIDGCRGVTAGSLDFCGRIYIVSALGCTWCRCLCKVAVKTGRVSRDVNAGTRPRIGRAKQYISSEEMRSTSLANIIVLTQDDTAFWQCVIVQIRQLAWQMLLSCRTHRRSLASSVSHGELLTSIHSVAWWSSIDRDRASAFCERC